MKRALYRLLFSLGPLVFGVALAETAKLHTALPGKPDAVLTMYADDPVMYRAMRRARRELDEFLEIAESPQRHQQNFAVRVAYAHGTQADFIWIANFKKDDSGLYAGIVDDEIRFPSQFKRGDRFTFVRSDIGDWTYTDTKKGRVYGAYTECALLTLAPQDVAAKIRADHKLDCEF
jgi:uncharacterized protein YegJ (DUF2314 family)